MQIENLAQLANFDDLEPGNIFISSMSYYPNSTPYIGVKALDKRNGNKPEALFLTGPLLDHPDLKNYTGPCIDSPRDMHGSTVLNITSCTVLQPTINPKTCFSYHSLMGEGIPKGALVYHENDIYMSALYHNFAHHRSYMMLVNLKSGAMGEFKHEDFNNSVAILGWKLLLSHQDKELELIYEYSSLASLPNKSKQAA